MAEVRVEETIVIGAPLEQVFEYRLDFTNLPSYNPNVGNLRRTDPGTDPGEGAEYLFDLTIEGAPDPLETPLLVTKVEPPDRFTYVTGPGFMAAGECTFENADVGTLVTLGYTLTLPGEIDAATEHALASMTRADARKELENIKKILES